MQTINFKCNDCEYVWSEQGGIEDILPLNACPECGSYETELIGEDVQYGDPDQV